jgi:hypothetical protein
MARMRVFRTVLSVLLAVLMAGPWSTLAAAATRQGAHPGAVSGAPQAESVPPMSQADLLTALNLLVYQSVGASGWQIDRLDATLDAATLQSGEGRQAGRGAWTVAVTDDQGQSLTLQGDLEFEVLVTRETGLATSNVTLGGTLSDGAVSLAIAAHHGGERRPQVTATQLSLTVDLTRSGETIRIRVQRTRSIAPVAYDMFRIAAGDRRARRAEPPVDETLLRALGKGPERGLADNHPAPGGRRGARCRVRPCTSSVVDGRCRAAVLRIAMTSRSPARHHLQSPSTASLALDGTVALNWCWSTSRAARSTRAATASRGLQSPLPGGEARLTWAREFLTSNEGAFLIASPRRWPSPTCSARS